MFTTLSNCTIYLVIVITLIGMNIFNVDDNQRKPISLAEVFGSSLPLVVRQSGGCQCLSDPKSQRGTEGPGWMHNALLLGILQHPWDHQADPHHHI